MGYTLTEKILREHLADGSYERGKEIGIKIDQTLTQEDRKSTRLNSSH